MFDYEKFSTRIVSHRKKLGYTQELLAEKVGIGYKHLSNIERGLAKPSVLVVIKLLNIFNINLNDFLKNDIDEKELKIKEIIFNINLLSLNQPKKEYLYAMCTTINKRKYDNGNK